MKPKGQRKIIIAIGEDRILFDGINWEPISGRRAQMIAETMAACEWRYERNAEAHPDISMNLAREAAKDFDGEIIEYDPLPAGPPNRIY